MPANFETVSHDHVLLALDEYARLGQSAFLTKYGYRKAREYYVVDPRSGSVADSKAVLGVAFGFRFPEAGPLAPKDFSGGDAVAARVLKGLGFSVIKSGDLASRSDEQLPWSREECVVLVSDYLEMLTCELTGQKYNKSERRRRLLPMLNRRSEGAIEFKRRNVSAVMRTLGFHPLRGYLPAVNTEVALLSQVILELMPNYRVLDEAASRAVEMPAVQPLGVDFSSAKVDIPRSRNRASDAVTQTIYSPVRRDYVEREARNRSLGSEGEKFILEYERWRLVCNGAGQLAERVIHVSEYEGDGLGYDIRSFEPDGRLRLVEVKTTAYDQTTPFYVSARELEVAKAESESYRLCRVFDFRSDPRFFELRGDVRTHCQLDPVSYRAEVR